VTAIHPRFIRHNARHMHRRPAFWALRTGSNRRVFISVKSKHANFRHDSLLSRLSFVGASPSLEGCAGQRLESVSKCSLRHLGCEFRRCTVVGHLPLVYLEAIGTECRFPGCGIERTAPRREPPSPLPPHARCCPFAFAISMTFALPRCVRRGRVLFDQTISVGTRRLPTSAPSAAPPTAPSCRCQ
jgi:hypothetical protein